MCIAAGFTSLAQGVYDPQMKTELSTLFKYDDGPVLIDNAKIHIKKAAERLDYSVFEAVDAVKGYGVSFENVDTTEKWAALANTLYLKIQADSKAPADVFSGKTGADGIFKQDCIEPGLYLVYADPVVKGNWRYKAIPFLIALPALNDDASDYLKTVSAQFKVERERYYVPSNTRETVDVKVLKVWNDAGAEALRPESITVHLLKNGAVDRTIELSAQNDWRWTWNNLSDSYSWTVSEDTVEGYTTLITKEGITYRIENTAIVVPEQPRAQVAGLSRLPQTGLMWWPAVVLLILGAGFIAFGIYRKKE